MQTDYIWDELSKVYNMPDVPDKAKSIIGDLMLKLDESSAQSDFDIITKIDKAHDDGYKQGYLQGKADYEPKTGKWIKVHGFCTPGGDPVWACSECGKGIHVYGVEHGTYGADVSDGQWKACPNCGCRMEGEEHES